MSKHPANNGSWLPKSTVQSLGGDGRSCQSYFTSAGNSSSAAWNVHDTYQGASQNLFNPLEMSQNMKAPPQQSQQTQMQGASSWDWGTPQSKSKQSQQPVVYHQQQQHQQMQQQQYHQMQQQHHYLGQQMQQHQSPNNFQKYPPHQFHNYSGYSQETNQDPWNWGWDDSSNFSEPPNSSNVSSNNNSSGNNSNNNNADPSWNWSVEGTSPYQNSPAHTENNASSVSTVSFADSFTNLSQSLSQVNYTTENQKKINTGNLEQVSDVTTVNNDDSNAGINYSTSLHNPSSVDINDTASETNFSNIEHGNNPGITENTDYLRTDAFMSVPQGVLDSNKEADSWKSDLPDNVTAAESHLKEGLKQPNWEEQDVKQMDITYGEFRDPESMGTHDSNRVENSYIQDKLNVSENMAVISENVHQADECVTDPHWCDTNSSSSSANLPKSAESIQNSRQGLPNSRASNVISDTVGFSENGNDHRRNVAEVMENITSPPSQDEIMYMPMPEPIMNQHFLENKSIDNEKENIAHLTSDINKMDLNTSDIKTEPDSLIVPVNLLNPSDLHCSQANGDVENVEIVPPETDFQSRAVYGNVEGTAAGGPLNLGPNINPYSRNKTLNQKHNTMYQAKSPIDATSSSRIFGVPVASEPGGNGISKTDTKGGTSRSRRAVDDAEDTVNLETVPDNKERPDVMEMQQSVLDQNSVSPMPRLHTVPVGQDAVLRPSMSWSHGQQSPTSFYGPAPDNQEVAPVPSSRTAGPDREQYLETGQLSEETATPPPGLHRMVPGEGGAPPPGLRRMVPGECSSPDTPAPSASSPEDRVVTGVAHDDSLQMPVQSTGNRVPSDNNSATEQSAVPSSLTQPPSERSETIGSDNVDLYPPQPTDTTSREPSNHRREGNNKERERRVADEQEVQERDIRRHNDYYEAHSSQSPARYRDERDTRRSYDNERPHEQEDRGHYRRQREDERSSHHRGSYERSEDDADTEDCMSDRDRDRRDRQVPREGYDRYRRRDRDRNHRDGHEKHSRERPEPRSAGRDRERRRHDNRERPDSGREDYYGRYYDDEMYKRDHRSRPTSRSGSRPDYDDYRRPDYHGYGYGYYGRPGLDPYHYDAYYSYKYYENLRRTNPAAYADWYAKYYGDQHHFQQGVYSEDRGSVHSGRSSENDDRYRLGHFHLDYSRSSSLIFDSDTRRHREQRLEPSVLEETASTTPQRLTPVKFMSTHVKGMWTTRGRILKILPHCPLEGQSAVVEVCDVSQIISDNDLDNYPGPLIRDVTHKNSLIAFCSRKIKKAERDPTLHDRASVILLWRLLILLLRQNGTVVGADIAELLVSSSSSSSSSTSSLSGTPVIQQQPVHDVHTDEQISKKCEEEITNQFREYLLYGNTKEALEWAMKYGLWGHALFLASKMDKRTHAQVMMRFANGLKMNDPLQTLYQLMSGRQPAAVTCCADEEWGDWKPHLAMILSNSTQRPELDHKAITTLGDTLGARGCLHAAHFCYLMAQLPFGIYSNKASKLVLLGSSQAKPFMEFACNEAIQMTEIYIYACQLATPYFELPQFEAYKLLYALRLAERGMVTEAIHYIEVLSNTVLQSTIQFPLSFLKQIYEAGNLLKHSDPVYTTGVEDITERDPVWLRELERFILNYGAVTYTNPGDSVSNLSSIEPLPPTYLSAGTEEQMAQPVQDSSYTDGWQQEQYSVYQGSQNSSWVQEPAAYDNSNTGIEDMGKPPEPTEYWKHPPQTTSQIDSHNLIGVQETAPSVHNEWEPIVTKKEKTEPGNTAPPASAKPKVKTETSKPVGSSASSSWFGGLWNKLSLRPKNQMKLPDDKNPSIVWNPEKNRWTNLDADDDDNGGDLPPPPKTELNKPTPSLTNVQEPQNKYKMAKVRSGRANYVDVLGSNKTTSQSIKTELFPSMNTQLPTSTYFVPAPADENTPTDFLSTAPSRNAEMDTSQDSSSAAAVSDYSIPPLYDPNAPNYQTTASSSSTTTAAAAATAARILYPN